MYLNSTGWHHCLWVTSTKRLGGLSWPLNYSRLWLLGQLPDMGEAASFEQFTQFNQQVKKVYSPGVNIALVSDGYVFNDVMEVGDNTVAAYNEAAQDMARMAPVQWFDLCSFYNRHTSLTELRSKVVAQHGITPEELERRILLDSDVNMLYRGMIRFMTLDLAIKPFASNSQLQKQAKILAREMMYRNEAYSHLVASEFKNHIRLSMHPSVNNGNKYSFALIPGPNVHHSPWHACLVINGGQYSTMHRREAEAQGMQLIYKGGQPWAYVAANN
jgi:pyoverdine/dityrosine biosynthesis protein Dit1